MAALVPFAISGRAAMKWREAKVATCAPKLGSRTSSARTCEERCREGDHCGLQKYPLLRPPIPRHRIVTSTRRPATAVHHTANCAPSLTSPSLPWAHHGIGQASATRCRRSCRAHRATPRARAAAAHASPACVAYAGLKLMMREKASALRLAPPTSAPSMSAHAIRASTLPSFTLPPYWMMTASATSAE